MICMAELTQAEKTKFWTDIKLQWKIVKEGKNGDVPMAQQQINILQEKLGVEVTDFNKETPQSVEAEPFTLAKAEEILGEENIKILEECLDRALAIRAVVADLTPKKDPKLKGNHAGIGQMVNITYDQSKDKLK